MARLTAAQIDVPLRNLWELLINVDNRPSWDSLTEKTENLVEVGPRNSKEPVTQRQASVSWLGMKGAFAHLQLWLTT